MPTVSLAAADNTTTPSDAVDSAVPTDHFKRHGRTLKGTACVATLTMYDTYGDDWNGAYWTWSDDTGQLATGTLSGTGCDDGGTNQCSDRGTTQSGTACLPEGSTQCYTYQMSDGDYAYEISWDLTQSSTGSTWASDSSGSFSGKKWSICGPTSHPTPQPTSEPTKKDHTASPTLAPTTLSPTPKPTLVPSPVPTIVPTTPVPSTRPSPLPSPVPSPLPTVLCGVGQELELTANGDGSKSNACADCVAGKYNNDAASGYSSCQVRKLP